MSKKSDILKIWQECFPADSGEWKKMFFDAAYCDDDALVLTDDDGTTASSLLLLPYTMAFHGTRVGLAYIYGAGTLRRYRARGLMGRLMVQAVNEAWERGDTFIGLIPASDSLRRYYSRFGFSTVGYSRPQRYTALHHFTDSIANGEYRTIGTADPLRLYPDFERLTAADPCGVMHSRTQFLTIMDDTRISETPVVAVARDGEDGVAAMAWARPEPASDTFRVTELIADAPEAAAAAMEALRLELPDAPLTLMARPSDFAAGGNLEPGAMLRVVRVADALAIIAAANPSLKLTVQVTDPIIADNEGTYRLNNGELEPAPSDAKIDLHVSAQVLTSMMFGSETIAKITGLPALRPRISLMLD